MTIRDSTFSNLRGAMAPAIYLKDMMNSDTLIENSRFIENVAKLTGAVRLEQSGHVTLKGNLFEGNQVEGDAGAIYFQCIPQSSTSECKVVLDSNMFRQNTATRRGGALRYVNTPFTIAASQG